MYVDSSPIQYFPQWTNSQSFIKHHIIIIEKKTSKQKQILNWKTKKRRRRRRTLTHALFSHSAQCDGLAVAELHARCYIEKPLAAASKDDWNRSSVFSGEGISTDMLLEHIQRVREYSSIYVVVLYNSSSI